VSEFFRGAAIVLTALAALLLFSAGETRIAFGFTCAALGTLWLSLGLGEEEDR
jgi:hypothetical protein